MKRLSLKNHPPLYLVLFFVFQFLLSCKPAPSQEVQIADIVVTNNQDSLLVYFFVKGCFTPGMEKAILNGIPITFNFLVEWYKPCSIWPKKKLSSLKLFHTVKYDSLRQEFSVTLSERGNQTFFTKDFSKAQEMMADVSNIQLVPLIVLEKNHHYQLRVKVELEKAGLPLYIRYILFFVSLWDFETDWNVVDFTY